MNWGKTRSVDLNITPENVNVNVNENINIVIKDIDPVFNRERISEIISSDDFPQPKLTLTSNIDVSFWELDNETTTDNILAKNEYLEIGEN
jgi:hypothetical protein